MKDDKRKGVYYFCNKLNHYVRGCRQRKKQKVNEVEEKLIAVMQEGNSISGIENYC